MEHYCYHCGARTELSLGASISVRDYCAKCNRDLHSCLNCQHYSADAYNECREPQAERTTDKEKANCCDFFRPSERGPQGTQTKSKEDYLKQLDGLFRKTG